MKPVVALALLLLCTPGCTTTLPQGTPSAPQASGGRQTRTITVDGRTRRYELALPPRPASAAGHPVVVAMHGAGSTIASLARASARDWPIAVGSVSKS